MRERFPGQMTAATVGVAGLAAVVGVEDDPLQ
jgi:hypothetical protein